MAEHNGTQERKRYNLNLQELFGPAPSWPVSLEDTIDGAINQLVNTDETVEQAFLRANGSIISQLVVDSNLQYPVALSAIKEYHENLIHMFTKFIDIPMKDYPSDIKDYNLARRQASLVDFRSICHAARICATADRRIVQTIIDDGIPECRTVNPYMGLNSRFHRPMQTAASSSSANPATNAGPSTKNARPPTADSVFPRRTTSLSTSAPAPPRLRSLPRLPIITFISPNSPSKRTEDPLLPPRTPYPFKVVTESASDDECYTTPTSATPRTLRRELRRIQDLEVRGIFAQQARSTDVNARMIRSRSNLPDPDMMPNRGNQIAPLRYQAETVGDMVRRDENEGMEDFRYLELERDLRSLSSGFQRKMRQLNR